MREEEILKAKRKGEFFKVELYRVIKNVINKGLKDNTTVFDIFPEVEVPNVGIADLVIFKIYESAKRHYQPFLLIETKENKIDQPRTNIIGEFIDGIKQAKRYREKLLAPYFVVYDGIYFLLFSVDDPYLRGALEVKISDLQDDKLAEMFAKDLILSLSKGLQDFEIFRKQYLPSNPQFVERILNSLIERKIFPINEGIKEYRLKDWKKLCYE